MPFSSHLPLSPSPRSVAEARRWVGRMFGELGRNDLIESAELGVSELVTNAMLHASAPISVRIRGTASHPRIEVTDGSTEPPTPPLRDEDDVLTTFGRGLGIVGRIAVSWGASVEREGKIVWFEPAAEIRLDVDPQWILDATHPDLEHEARRDSAVPVTLLGLDLGLYRTLGRQYAELRRELRLLSLGHKADYPLAGNLTSMFDTFERQFPADYQHQILQAMAVGQSEVDVTVDLMPESSGIFVTMGEMFDVADAFCRAERLLALARTPEQRSFNNWMLGELIRQLDGGDPHPWQGMASAGPVPAPRVTHRQSQSQAG